MKRSDRVILTTVSVVAVSLCAVTASSQLQYMAMDQESRIPSQARQLILLASSVIGMFSFAFFYLPTRSVWKVAIAIILGLYPTALSILSLFRLTKG